MTTSMRIQSLRESQNETSSRASRFARENLSRSLTTQANKIAPRNVIQDGHGFWILRRGSWISDSLSVELIFGIPIVRGIPGSLSWIPDSKAQDSRIPRASLRTLLREIKIPKSKISTHKNPSIIPVTWNPEYTLSRHWSYYCTWKLTLLDINTTPKKPKPERGRSRRQRFRHFCGSSVRRNEQRISAVKYPLTLF